MTTHHSIRIFSLVCLLSAALFSFAAPAAAVSFTVHDYQLGEQIELTNGNHVWTAELDVTLGNKHSTSFCVDLDTHISRSTYQTRGVLDAYTSPSPADERTRNFAWAGYVMDVFGHDLSVLTGGGVTRTQAITGVQAAIWEGIYGGGVVNASSLSSGARSIFDEIMGSQYFVAGHALIAELRCHQDQVVSNPVPEPAAAMVFGVGLFIVGRGVRRRPASS